MASSLMIKSYRFAGFTIKGDAIELVNTEHQTSLSMKTLRLNVYYDKIDGEVFKTGAHYAVRAYMSSWWTAEDILFLWKSEADAKNFVDASYVLRRKGVSDKKLVRADTAAYHPYSSKEPVAKGIKAPALVSDSAPPKLPSVSSVENIPPKITITSPNVTRHGLVIAKRYRMTVAGMVESSVGIAYVLINGEEAELDENGRFSSDVFLKVGRNEITVAAADIRKNQATSKFIINREKHSRAKADTPELVAKKDTSGAMGQKSAIQPITISTPGKSTPRIVITSPDVTRAVSVVAKRTIITVTGVAESTAGIVDVMVNGQSAALDEKGQFSANILLKVGSNEVIVSAVDVLQNQAVKRFVINRDAGKVASAKTEASIQEASLPFARYYALIIAVQDYDSPEINKLDYPLTDAKKLADTLMTRYTFEREDIQILQNPDRRAIYKSLQSLRYKLTEKDNLLIFYAGHGTWMEDMRQGFWLPRDASGINDPSDWVPNSNIRDYIKAIKAKHILLVADACFSGGIFKVRTAFPDPKTSMKKIYELASRKAITSGSLKTVPDRSVFVEFLVKRLTNNLDPYLDSQKLFTSLREAVINNSPTNQTPLYGAINETGDEGGDFVFVRRQ